MAEIILPGFERIGHVIGLVADRGGLNPEKAADLVWRAIETSDVRIFERGRITWWNDSDAAGTAQRALDAWRQAARAGRYDPYARRRSSHPRRSPAPTAARDLFSGTVHLGDLERGLARLGVMVSLSPLPEPRRSAARRRRGRPPAAPWQHLRDDLFAHMVEHGKPRRIEAVDWALDWCARHGYPVEAPSTVEPYVDETLARFDASLDRAVPLKRRAAGN
jgi:hypothetical protein